MDQATLGLASKPNSNKKYVQEVTHLEHIIKAECNTEVRSILCLSMMYACGRKDGEEFHTF